MISITITFILFINSLLIKFLPTSIIIISRGLMYILIYIAYSISYVIITTIFGINRAAWNEVTLLTIYSIGFCLIYIISIIIHVLKSVLSYIINLNQPSAFLFN